MGRVRKNFSLRPFTTFKVGGPVRFFLEATTPEEVKKGFQLAQQENLPLFVLGGGSNLLINDETLIEAVVLRLRNKSFQRQGTKVIVGAGLELDRLVQLTIENGLRGLELLAGIPGTVGGAIFGNAGAYGRTIADCLVELEVFDGQRFRKLSREECQFDYRESLFKEKNWVIWQAKFQLEPGEKEVLRNLAEAIRAYRRVRYPPSWRSAGSFFKNVSPEKFSPKIRATLPRSAFSGQLVAAGFLIEQVGLLGKTVGGAKIAEHQGNYFLNYKNARARDLIKLAQLAQEKVFRRFRVKLEPEVQLIGFEGKIFD